MRRGKQEEETGPRSRGKKVRVGAERSLVGERGRLGLEEGDPRGSLRLCSSRQGSHSSVKVFILNGSLDLGLEMGDCRD